MTSATPIGSDARISSHALTQAEKSVQADGFVKDLVNLFDGKVVDSTIRDSVSGERK